MRFKLKFNIVCGLGAVPLLSYVNQSFHKEF